MTPCLLTTAAAAVAIAMVVAGGCWCTPERRRHRRPGAGGAGRRGGRAAGGLGRCGATRPAGRHRGPGFGDRWRRGGCHRAPDGAHPGRHQSAGHPAGGPGDGAAPVHRRHPRRPVRDAERRAPDRRGRAGRRWPTGAEQLPGPARCVRPELLLLLAVRADQSEVLAGLTPATRCALRNAQLAAVARARLAEVQASQRRIVAASDAERRGIERDLHDGANNAWSASRSTRGSPSLVPIRRPPRGSPAPRPGVRDALAHLRRLAHGIFPSVLATEGLALPSTSWSRPPTSRRRSPSA